MKLHLRENTDINICQAVMDAMRSGIWGMRTYTYVRTHTQTRTRVVTHRMRTPALK